MFDIGLVLYLIIDCFSLAILIILILNMSRHQDLYLLERKLFVGLICLDAVIILLDMSMWLLDGTAGQLSRSAYLFVTVCYYTLNPIICMMWYFIADYQIFKDEKRIRNRLIPMLLPALVNMLISILSVFLQNMFYLDENNVYHRGSLFHAMALVCLFYLLYTQILIIRNHKQIAKKDFMPMMVFVIPPLIGGFIQTLFYGVSLVWACVTLSILIIFINIQNDQLHKDYLTGLFNRRELDRYLQTAVQNVGKRTLYGIMIDINAFKMINDIYGHSVGDEALQATADILRKTFRKNDFIARYGGDEFVVLTFQEKDALYKAIDRLKENVELLNAQDIVPYKISLSLGYDGYSRQSGLNSIQFLKHIDKLMYQDKKTTT